jgi:hypothetical protein
VRDLKERGMKALSFLALGVLAGCAGVERSGPGAVKGRVVSNDRFLPKEFSVSGRTYVDRRFRVDATGGLADAAAYLEGGQTAPWVSGRVVMKFGENQFEPRVAFVSPGQPVEVGDMRDEAEHEVQVNLKGLDAWTKRVQVGGLRRTDSGKPDVVSLECKDGFWKASGNVMVPMGRTKEMTFSQPVLVPLDWD